MRGVKPLSASIRLILSVLRAAFRFLNWLRLRVFHFPGMEYTWWGALREKERPYRRRF